MAAADNADGLACELPPRHLTPAATLHFARTDRGSMQEVDGRGHNELGDGSPVDAARPAEENAAPLHGPEIDHVETDTILAHDLQLRKGLKKRRIEWLERRDGALVMPQECDQLVASQRTAVVVERDARVSRQQLGAKNGMPREGARCAGDRRAVFHSSGVLNGE